MAVRNLYGIKGTLTATLTDSANLIEVSPDMTGEMIAAGFESGDQSWFAIYTEGAYEIVQVSTAAGGYLVALRGQSGTTAHAFPIGATIEFVVTVDAVLAQMGTIAPTSIIGTGLVEAVEAPENTYTINVDSPSITGAGGVTVLGTWPTLEIAYSGPDDGCCDGGSGGGSGAGILSLTGSGIATAYVSGTVGFVSVATPSFTGAGGITVTGAWPNFTITGSGGGGGGTVTSVSVGTGLTLTGSPTLNPTLAITNTGVTAGTYGQVIVNAQGQFTSIDPAFNPVSSIGATAPLSATRTGATYALTVGAAGIGVAGVAPLADPVDPLDDDDTTSIVTPALLAAVLGSTDAITVSGASSYTGEADGLYTNSLSSTITAVDLADGERAIVHAEATCLDGTTPTTPVPFGIGVFNALGAKIQSNKIISQCQQSMTFFIEGPVTTTLALNTTAVPGTATLISYGLWVLKL